MRNPVAARSSAFLKSLEGADISTPIEVSAGPETLEPMYTETTTHTTLLARIRDGEDPTAWREFEERYGELIRRFARRRDLQPADCDDIAQEVLLSLSRAMPDFRYDPAKGKFRAYLKTATLRAVFKKRQKPGDVDLEYVEDSTRLAGNDTALEHAWEREWRQYHLRQAMRVVEAEFNNADRRAFQLYAVEGGEARAVADELKMSVDQVYQAKSRMMKRLREIIDAQVEEEG